MGYLYVLVDEDKPGAVKVGKTKCTREDLLRGYMRGNPRARLLLFAECPDYGTAEQRIKQFYRESRVINANGRRSEWIEGVPAEDICAHVRGVVAAAVAADTAAHEPDPVASATTSAITSGITAAIGALNYAFLWAWSRVWKNESAAPVV